MQQWVEGSKQTCERQPYQQSQQEEERKPYACPFINFFGDKKLALEMSEEEKYIKHIRDLSGSPFPPQKTLSEPKKNIVPFITIIRTKEGPAWGWWQPAILKCAVCVSAVWKLASCEDRAILHFTNGGIMGELSHARFGRRLSGNKNIPGVWLPPDKESPFRVEDSSASILTEY